MRIEHNCHRRMRDYALRSGRFECDTAEKGARFERAALLRQLDKRSAAARADDLDEAEAVDCRPFERLRQRSIDSGGGGLAGGFAGNGREVDADRAAYVEPHDGPRRFSCTGNGELL